MENGSGWKNNPAKEGLAVGYPGFLAQAGVGMGERDLVGTQPGLSLAGFRKARGVCPGGHRAGFVSGVFRSGGAVREFLG